MRLAPLVARVSRCTLLGKAPGTTGKPALVLVPVEIGQTTWRWTQAGDIVHIERQSPALRNSGDSLELFVVLGLSMLRDGGTLALVLPDTFFSPEKARLREILLTQTQLEILGRTCLLKHTSLAVQWPKRLVTAPIISRRSSTVPHLDQGLGDDPPVARRRAPVLHHPLRT